MRQPRPSTEITAQQAVRLSAEDVQRLLVPDPQGEGRFEVASKLAGNYGSNHYNEAETAVAEQIFRLLVRDAELKVRAMLAELLQHSSHLPRDIALTMAQDVRDEVALPILRSSEVLTEEDLCMLVSSMEMASRQQAIGSRKRVPERVAGALLAKKRKDIVLTLVRNRGADLNEQMLSEIADTYGAEAEVMSSLAERPNIPVPVVEKVMARVSGTLAEELRKKYHLVQEELQEEEKNIRLASTMALLRQNPTAYELEKLTEQLMNVGRLTPRMMLLALSEGHLEFFEMCLSKLSGVPLANTRKLLSDRGDLGFRALYNKSGMEAHMFPAVRALMLAVREVGSHPTIRRGRPFANAVMRRYSHALDALSAQNLSSLIASPEDDVP